jgi:hypothetical protein
MIEGDRIEEGGERVTHCCQQFRNKHQALRIQETDLTKKRKATSPPQTIYYSTTYCHRHHDNYMYHPTSGTRTFVRKRPRVLKR